MSNLGDEVTAFAVVRTLILEPLSIALYASNLLAIVVRDRVGDGVGGGIDAVLADAVEEFLLFLEKEEWMLDLDIKKSHCAQCWILTMATDGLNRR